ncbi:MAG: hypothetical protein ABIF10_05095 [Candidatus Woesearchaeota archaeon]
MLSEKRVREAQANVKSYLQEGLLKKEQYNSIVFSVLTNNSNESIETAGFLADNRKSNLWVIVSAYYSMFYIANAVLYKLGYKVGDRIPHKVTSDSLIVYVRNKLADNLIEDYEEMKEEALLIAKNKAEGLLEDFDSERKKRGISSIRLQKQTSLQRRRLR